ncbi:hypothetical protein C8R44DRAFT_778244 [Mycena epipterygia]|nr:hypothetical protein C8R44DRAFT_778244 [Mycena epipterygia]
MHVTWTHILLCSVLHYQRVSRAASLLGLTSTGDDSDDRSEYGNERNGPRTRAHSAPMAFLLRRLRLLTRPQHECRAHIGGFAVLRAVQIQQKQAFSRPLPPPRPNPPNAPIPSPSSLNPNAARIPPRPNHAAYQPSHPPTPPLGPHPLSHEQGGQGLRGARVCSCV